jgi:lysophosphatidate acyltransferase
MSALAYAVAGPAAVVMILRAVSFILPAGPARLASYAAFTLTAFGLLIVCASYGVVASIVLRCVGYGGLSQWTVARAFKWSMWMTTGVTFRVGEGGKTEGGRRGGDEALAERPAVFVGNHQT